MTTPAAALRRIPSLSIPKEKIMLAVMRRRFFGAAAVASLAFLASTTGADPVPAESYSRTTEADIAHLEALVELAKTKRGIPNRVKATAMLIAGSAQQNLNDPKMVALRDAALKVAEAAAKKNIDAAAIAALKNPPAGGDSKPLKLATMHKIDLADIMNVFGSASAGGLNIEKDIRDLKKPGTKVDPKHAELIGVRTVAIADFALALPPEFNAKNKKVDWDRWSNDMKSSATELAAEAAKGAKADSETMRKTINKLDASCVNCHNVFRD